MLDINKVSCAIGPYAASDLIGLHVFIDCDTTSAFYGKGKKRAFTSLCQNQTCVEAFCKLGNSFSISSELPSALEKFVGELYGCPGICSVNEARYKAFCSPTTSSQSLPLTHDALMQHLARANYQAAIHRRQWFSLLKALIPSAMVGYKQMMANWRLNGCYKNLLQMIFSKPLIANARQQAVI